MANDEAKHVFVSYVREDADRVDQLCALLEAAQIPYWRDRTSLGPGDQWKPKIRDAIRSDALVFLACFSERSRAKPKSYMNEELTLAVEEFRKLPPGATWLIPVRFDDGDIPDWDLGAGRLLSDLNFVDLYSQNYATAAVRLTLAINQLMGTKGLDAATLRASIEEADAAQRPALMSRMTKDMILDPARRIELDEVISEETQRILTAMRDEERFPTQLSGGSTEDHVVRCVEVAASYWQLAEPFCASLQVAARWADGQGLAPWISALRSVAGEAMKAAGGNTALLRLRHVPALTATFTAALAATGQGRWDNLKALLVDLTIPRDYGEGRQALIQAENPWTPFPDESDWIPSVAARVAKTGETPRTALEAYTSKQVGKYKTPAADWLHAILRRHFTDQYPDHAMFDDAFDRTEVMLGLISQDIANIEIGDDPERAWAKQSLWFGRSTWRARYRPGVLGEIESEIQSQAASWAPLAAGLFGGQLDRVTAATKEYAELFRKIANSR